MAVHLVYRLYGGENQKGRPDYYSKLVCLASCLRAAEIAGVDVTVLADGPIPDEWRMLIVAHGKVIDLPGGPVGMRGSYLAALRYAIESDWPDQDLVYFSEDDYMHGGDAFVALDRAAAAVRQASYFALYASTPSHPTFGPGKPHSVPHDFVADPDAEIDGQRWVHVPSTTSSFAARLGALRADHAIFRQGMIPYPERFLDHETCVVYQGRFPYSGRDVFLGLEQNRSRTGWRALLANIFLTPFRIAYNARALTRRRHPHRLYAADPNLSCHLETAVMSPGVDWARHAELARKWLQERRLSAEDRGEP